MKNALIDENIIDDLDENLEEGTDNVLSLNNEAKGHKLYQEELKDRIKVGDLKDEIALLEDKKTALQSEFSIIRKKAKRAQAIINEAESSIDRVYENRAALEQVQEEIELSQSHLQEVTSDKEKIEKEILEKREEEAAVFSKILELNNQTSELENNFNLKSQDLEQLNVALIDIEEKIEEKNMELNQVLIEISEFRSQRQKAKNYFDEVHDKKISLDNEISELEQIRESLKVDQLVIKNDIEESQKNHTSLKLELESIKDDISTKQGIISTLQEEKIQIEQEVKQSSLVLKKLNKRVEKLLSQHQDAESSYTALIDKNAQCKNEINTLVSEIEQREFKLNELNHLNSELLSKNNELATQIESLSNEILDREDNVELLVNREKELNLSVNNLKKEEEGYTNSIETKLNTISKLKDDISDNKLKLAELSSSIEGLNNDMSRLLTEKSSLEDSVSSLEVKNTQLERANEKLKEENNHFETKRSSLSLAVDNLNKEIDSLREDHKKINLEKDEVQEKLLIRSNKLTKVTEELEGVEKDLELTLAESERLKEQYRHDEVEFKENAEAERAKILGDTKSMHQDLMTSCKTEHKEFLDSAQQEKDKFKKEASSEKAKLENDIRLLSDSLAKLESNKSKVQATLEDRKKKLDETRLELANINDNWSVWTKRKTELFEKIADSEDRLAYLKNKNIESEQLKERTIQEIAELKVAAQKNIEETHLEAEKELKAREEKVMSEAQNYLLNAKREYELKVQDAQKKANDLIESAQRDALSIKKKAEMVVANKRMEDVKQINSEKIILKKKMYEDLEKKVDYIKGEILEYEDGISSRDLDSLFDDYLFGNEYIHSKKHVKKLVKTLKINPLSLKSSKKFWKKLGLSIVTASVVGIIAYMNSDFLNDYTRELFTEDTKYQEKYISDLKTDREKKFYRPMQDTRYRDNITDNILYNSEYLDKRLNQEYQNEFAIKLSDFIVSELRLDDLAVIEIISKESRLVKNLAIAAQKIPVDLKDEKINDLREVEAQTKAELLKILKTDQNYKRYQIFSKAFYLNN